MLHNYYENLHNCVAIYFAFNQSSYSFNESDGEVFITVKKGDGQQTEVTHRVCLSFGFGTASNEDFDLSSEYNTQDCPSAAPPVIVITPECVLPPQDTYAYLPPPPDYVIPLPDYVIPRHYDTRPPQIYYIEPDEEYIRIPIQIFQDEIVESSEYFNIRLLQSHCVIEIIDDDGNFFLYNYDFIDLEFHHYTELTIGFSNGTNLTVQEGVGEFKICAAVLKPTNSSLLSITTFTLIAIEESGIA